MECRRSGKRSEPPTAPSCGPRKRIAGQDLVCAGSAQVQVKLYSFKRSEIEVSHGGYLFAKSLHLFVFYTRQRQMRLIRTVFLLHTKRGQRLINSTCQLMRFGRSLHSSKENTRPVRVREESEAGNSDTNRTRWRDLRKC